MNSFRVAGVVSEHLDSTASLRIYRTEESLFNFICRPIAELQRVQLVFVKAACGAEMSDRASFVSHPATHEGVRTEIQEVVLALPREQKAFLVPSRYIVMDMCLFWLGIHSMHENKWE